MTASSPLRTRCSTQDHVLCSAVMSHPLFTAEVLHELLNWSFTPKRTPSSSMYKWLIFVYGKQFITNIISCLNRPSFGPWEPLYGHLPTVSKLLHCFLAKTDALVSACSLSSQLWNQSLPLTACYSEGQLASSLNHLLITENLSRNHLQSI